MSTLALVFLSLTLKSRNKELAAARALLREVLKEADEWHDEARGTALSSEAAVRARSYLDACDTLGSDTVPDEVAP